MDQESGTTSLVSQALQVQIRPMSKMPELEPLQTKPRVL